ncbi:FtsH protease activity modulator HflK [Parvularcula dongshanensis]|uniref:Protein HflK n=1 Tax=Parvularcula dongshanensis TaxID=1173995 RepID=A0A840I2B8_9PROT|nr:FtsH protease activity modulator HflK [Parvularcula dongshanensis]MBB4659156.1 membrane protease subunit HflK [Parvularcula dongshanensis]
MPWTDKPGSGNKGPWGQQPGEGNRPSNGNGRRPGQSAPDLEELLRSGRERFRKGGGGKRPPRSGDPIQLPSGRAFLFGAAALGVLYLASGIYQIQPGERGVVTTFGKFTGLTGPGLNWHMPWPFQRVVDVDVQGDRAVTIGRGQGGRTSMLTSDLNIVDVDMQVNYRIKDDADTAPGELPNAAKFAYNIEDPTGLVKSAAEAALREVVGGEEFGPIISRGRSIVNEGTADILQQTLDSYDSGIQVIRVNFGEATPPQEVRDSQLDVVNARSDAEQRVNVATGYANQRVPVARGQARQTVLDAEAYAARVVAEARGDAARFVDIYDEYARAPEVTRRRMYLETMEEVLGDMNKIVIDENAGGTMPYLNLNELARQDQNRRANTGGSN